jgi:ABC-type amino acid transport system permease subunit
MNLSVLSLGEIHGAIVLLDLPLRCLIELTVNQLISQQRCTSIVGTIITFIFFWYNTKSYIAYSTREFHVYMVLFYTYSHVSAQPAKSADTAPAALSVYK